jgi:hypothetical protein
VAKWDAVKSVDTLFGKHATHYGRSEPVHELHEACNDREDQGDWGSAPDSVGTGEVQLECKTPEGPCMVTLREVRHVPACLPCAEQRMQEQR